MKEIEVKARLRDEQQVINSLNRMGVELSAPISQRDRVYFPKGKTPGQEPGLPALRLRDQDGLHIFTFKVPDKNNLDKIEYESQVSDPEAVAHICLRLGFDLTSEIGKVRRKAVYKDYEICLDEVEGLGAFIEVEKMAAEGDSEQIQDELFAFLESLGITAEDRVHEGYDILLHKLKQKTSQNHQNI